MLVTGLCKTQTDTTSSHSISVRPIELSVWGEDDQEALILSKSNANKAWRPLTQKSYFLIPVILTSGALVALLQVYLERSNREKGILFASTIENLPVLQKFSYTYLPTIVSLVIGFVWTWIDLDIKRLQPFIQLSRESGASGKDSILLHYPFDFVAFVPFAAASRRHWPVFFASTAVVLILWGLTPLQSSIFASRSIHRTIQVPTASSTSYLSLHEQQSTLTGHYAQSVYNIAWLNESLPPFVSRQGMLAPFSLLDVDGEIELSETLTAPTIFFSVDVDCEEPTYADEYILSSYGCKYYVGNMDLPSGTEDGEYNSLYVGYWYEESMDSYLRGDCPKEANQTFLVRWSRGRQKLDDSRNSPTSIEGTTLWYQQKVNATVARPKMNVLSVVPIGPKEQFRAGLTNITDLEWSMSQGYEKNNNRGPYPTSGWPKPYDRVHAKFPELYWDHYLPTLATFALAAYQRPVADYLDAEILRKSYEAAYRLLLARKLADILSSDLDNSTVAVGTRQYDTQAVVMVPLFVYLVESLLIVTLLVALAMLALRSWKKSLLASEPASIASLMALLSNDLRTIQEFGRNDRATSHDLEELYQNTTFALKRDRSSEKAAICCFDPPSTPSSARCQEIKPFKPVLPMELSWICGICFVGLQACVASALGYTYIRAYLHNGLPLPSDILLVNQVLEKHLPMVISAVFEPIWAWLTRTLCMLQPYEELRTGNVMPSRSMTLDYSSLPPQAVLIRAFKAGHFSLALICLMTLLANLLSVAFGGLLYESTIISQTPQNFTARYQPRVNGHSLPNSTYDHFYVAMSNLTAGTPLPPWTDDSFFFVPFETPSPENTPTALYQAQTYAIGASIHCVPLRQTQRDGNLTWEYLAEGTKCDLSKLPTFSSVQSHQPEAIEYATFSRYGYAPTCDLAVLVGWGRSIRESTTGPLDATWIGCRPQVQVNIRAVTVDSQGFVQYSEPTDGITDDQESFFRPSSSNLIASVHKMLDYSSPKYPYTNLSPYHNDSNPSDFFNYLMVQMLNSSAILDPGLPPPSFNATAPVLEALYTKLFAIVLGTHISEILEPFAATKMINGATLAPEVRVFVSKPMFDVAAAILAIYMLVTMMLYVRRPWKILPRMPTTIASQMAFFAASHTLSDFSGTSNMSEKERNTYVRGLGQRYGFGRFVGTDGKTHIGIEREPLVQILTKEDLRSMQTKTDIDPSHC